MPEWVEISGQDVVMITFACVYVLAGLGMYLSLVREKSAANGMNAGIRLFLKKKIEETRTSPSALRWSFHIS
ncbi:hypothetical protein [Roseibium sediminicola]|uniref:Uncharacterized protein n=1 Tax=Roseibium sediminicola TaxID=2933272 RepID=A0ABT0GYA4_9HYPH|nr:hypothetical protein [Roseibium sp. CAU 1639]MCK7614418.1 hypothetical protein [Roseibium sp. CAU 1639]